MFWLSKKKTVICGPEGRHYLRKFNNVNRNRPLTFTGRTNNTDHPERAGFAYCFHFLHVQGVSYEFYTIIFLRQNCTAERGGGESFFPLWRLIVYGIYYCYLCCLCEKKIKIIIDIFFSLTHFSCHLHPLLLRLLDLDQISYNL